MSKAIRITSTLRTKLRQHYLRVVAIAAVLLLILVVYRQDLAALTNEALQNESLNYVLLVPFLAGFLFYLKKDAVAVAQATERNRSSASQHTDSLLGVILCLIAFLTYWYGSYTFYPLEVHLLSLPIFLAGTITILLNTKALRTFIVPLLFLLFLIPIPARTIYEAGSVLSNVNTLIAHRVLTAVGVPVTLSTAYGPPILQLTGTASGTPVDPFTVGLPCSGVYSIIAFALLGTFLLVITQGPPVKKALMIATGLLLFELLNVLRITAIVAIAYAISVDLAMTVFHAAAGLILIFIGILLTLFTAEKAFNLQILPRPVAHAPCPECQPSRDRYESFCVHCGRLLKPIRERLPRQLWVRLMLLLLCSSIVILSLNAPTFVLAEKSIQTTSGFNIQNATTVLPMIPNRTIVDLGRDTKYEHDANVDVSLRYGYYPPANTSAPVMFTYINVGDTLSSLHNWEVCLITWQTAQGKAPLVQTLESKDIQLLTDRALIARYLVFHEDQRNYTQSTLYWFQRATFNTGTTVTQKYVRLSLIIITQNTTDYHQFEPPLVALGQTIADHWGLLTDTSRISLGIPAQQLLLAASVIFLVGTKTTQYTTEQRKRSINLRLFTTQASPNERTALNTIRTLAKEKRTIHTADIQHAIAQKTHKPISLTTLLKVLTRLEQYDFIRRDIITINSQPTAAWRVQISPLYKS